MSRKSRKLFDGFTFTIVGDLESRKSHDELGKMIKKLGGSYLKDKLRNHVTHVVSSPEAFSSDNYKIRRARRRKMIIVHENYVIDTYDNSKRYDPEDYNIDKYVVPKTIPVKATKPVLKKSGSKRQAIDDVLPLEIWREILYFVTTKDLVLQISLINTPFHQIVDSDAFWRSMCLRKLKLPFLCNRNRNQSQIPEKMKTIYDHLGDQSWKKVYQLLPEKSSLFEYIEFCYFPISEHRPLRISRKEARKKVDNAFHFQNSKMGGYPLLLKGEEWPKCTECSRHLKFFYQINTDELPDSFPKTIKLPKNALFQFFYCADGCDDDNDDNDLCCSFEIWKQDSKRFRWIRDLDQVGDGRGKYDMYKYIKKPWTEYLITGWDMRMDWPSVHDYTDSLKKKIEDQKERTGFLRKEFPEVFKECGEDKDDDYFEDSLYDYFMSNEPDGKCGLKLLGFGSYIQDEEPGICPKCKKNRRLFTQVNESKELPLMWGDCGNGWIHICDDCTEESLSYEWSCS